MDRPRVLPPSLPYGSPQFFHTAVRPFRHSPLGRPGESGPSFKHLHFITFIIRF